MLTVVSVQDKQFFCTNSTIERRLRVKLRIFILCTLCINPFLPEVTAKQLFPGFFTFFYAIFKFLRPEHDCNAKFTSCST